MSGSAWALLRQTSQAVDRKHAPGFPPAGQLTSSPPSAHHGRMLAIPKFFLIVVAILTASFFSGANAQSSNVFPLAFGMTPQQVSDMLRSPLIRIRSRGSSEVFVAQYDAGVPSFYPVDEGVWLQFRRGLLTGWRMHWKLRRGWF
jgi:hypothetical protein